MSTPDASAAPDPDSAGPDSAGPDSAGPDSAGPDSAGPDSAGPDTAGPDTAGPDTAGPDTAGPDSAGPVPATRLYDPESIAIATFLGSVLAGALLWALNERRTGRPGRGSAALGIGAGIVAVLVLLGDYIPGGAGAGISVGMAVGALQLGRRWVRDAESEGRVREPVFESRWKAAGIGLVMMVALLGAIFGFTMLGPDSLLSRVEIRPGAYVYYEGGVDAEEARRLGEHLRGIGFLDGEHEVDITYARTSDGHALSLIVTPAYLAQPGMEQAFRELATELRAFTDPSGTLELRLCNELWSPHRRMRVP